MKSGEYTAAAMIPGGGFEHLRTHPEDARIFNEAMVNKSFAQIKPLLCLYDFTGFETIGDNSAATRLTSHPNLPQGEKASKVEAGGQVDTTKLEMLGVALMMPDEFPAACRGHDDGITLRK